MALRIVGASLLPFAVVLWRNAARLEPDHGEARTAIALDVAWVLGSAVLLLGDLWPPLRPAGTWAVIGVGLIVLDWAVLQTLGLVRAMRAASPQA